jgi:hypothetical protein
LLGAFPKLPWIVSELGDALPIVTETYDRLQEIGLSVGEEYVGLGDAALNLIELVLAAIAEATIVCRAFHDMCAMGIGLVEAVRRGVCRLLPMLALVIGMEIGRILVFFLVAFRSHAFWYTAPLSLLPPSDVALRFVSLSALQPTTTYVSVQRTRLNGSWGDALNDEEVLSLLKHYNAPGEVSKNEQRRRRFSSPSYLT